jgi:biopolymer transport protein TolQ
MNQEPAEAPKEALDPLELVFQSSGVVLVVLMILVVASLSVWFIWFLKGMQLRRLENAQEGFEAAAKTASSAADLAAAARQHPHAPGARIVRELSRKRAQPNLSAELLMSVAKRAIVDEQKRAGKFMPTLSSIASSAPFVGLFGTVWGIMDAFLQIGVHKSASLPVVAPAIGEALIATAFGLVAAIPATIGYNFVDQRIQDLLAELEASSETWVELLAIDPNLSHTAGLSRRAQE